jgi:enoyl-CoA hydratase/carnithine racemase
MELSIEDRVARLTLSRPEQMNTMSPASWRDLEGALD